MLVADLHECIRLHVLATVKSGQLTQRALGQMIGVKQAHISNFLHGKRGLSIEGMDSILNALGLDVTRLVAMSKHTPDRKDCSPTLDSVPLIQHQAAMNPIFGKHEILGQLGFSKVLLRRLKEESTDARKQWIRFIAIKADASLAAPMHPRVSNGSVLLVDRHYSSMAGYHKDDLNLYLVCSGETLMVRWAEMQGTQLCLRPESSDHPLDFIRIDRKKPLTSYIVGRVAHVGTELGYSLVQRRPILPG